MSLGGVAPPLVSDVAKLHRHAGEMMVEIVAMEQPSSAGIVRHDVSREALHVSHHDRVLQDRVAAQWRLRSDRDSVRREHVEWLLVE